MSMNLEKDEVSTGADRTSLIERVLTFLSRWYVSIDMLAEAKERAEINDDHERGHRSR